MREGVVLQYCSKNVINKIIALPVVTFLNERRNRNLVILEPHCKKGKMLNS